MKISRELYKTMQDQTAPRSKSWKNIPLAFLIGGLICTIGEAGIHILTEYCGMEQKNASAWVSIGLVAVSAVCTGLGWYAKLGKHAGAGTLVPITGFANGVGVVDSDYRGELKVPMVNLGAEAYTIQPGERVAQLCIAPVYTAAFVPAEELGDTQRGVGGFGSTGK